MIGPLLIVALLAYSATERAKPLPCARNTCTAIEQWKDDQRRPETTVYLGKKGDRHARVEVER